MRTERIVKRVYRWQVKAQMVIVGGELQPIEGGVGLAKPEVDLRNRECRIVTVGSSLHSRAAVLRFGPLAADSIA